MLTRLLRWIVWLIMQWHLGVAIVAAAVLYPDGVDRLIEVLQPEIERLKKATGAVNAGLEK